MLKKLLGISALTAAFANPALAELPREINFGIIATESAQNLRQDWQPVLEDMSRKLGVKVNGFFASDYAGVIEAMRFGKVHVAWMGNKSGMEAVDRASGEVFAQIMYADGSPGYWSLLITHKDSPYKSIEDVIRNGKSITFGMGDPNSTSGYLVPSYYVFAMNKVDPKTLFKAVRSANHEVNLLAVVNKQVDVAAVNTEIWDKYETKSPERIRELRAIWKSPLIPSDPLVWRKDLAADAKEKIGQFFYTYGAGPDAQREKAALLKLTYSAFKPSNNNQLIPIRQLELFKDKTKYENDTSMNAAEREARLRDINRKLAELNQQLASIKQ